MSACFTVQRCIMCATYWYALLLGLLPVPLNRGTMAPKSAKPSRRYLTYSVLVHCISLSAIAIIGHDVYQNKMPGGPTLEAMYTVTNLSKLVAILLLIAEVWCKRSQFTATLLAYEAFLQRHSLPPNPTRFEERRFERLIVFQFVTGTTYGVLATIIYLDMHSKWEHAKVNLSLANFMLMTFVLTVMALFYYILCRLHAHFEHINRELTSVLLQLRRFSAEAHNDARAEELARRVSALGAMHYDCFRLTQSIFRLSGVACASIMLRFFFTNVRIVYYAVLFNSQRFAAGSWTVLTEIALIVCFYGDIWLLVSAVDAVLTSCTRSGSLLRQSSELLELRHYPSLLRELEQFADHVRCHKLKYRVCGFFDFDKEASLCYFLSVFVKVSVLVQFDLSYEAST